ncbi:MAG: glycerol-3-phosphate dehydrogenase/oxidase, partial [Chitinophagaceae bacterium]
GVIYHDGQFDDSRLALNLAQTAIEQGGTVLNYFNVKQFIKAENKIAGVIVEDTLSKKEFEIKAKVVINATGVFSDAVQQLDEPGKESTITPSQGIHIVLDKEFLPGKAAIMIPHTDDGRVLFAVPWHEKTIVGTTDTLVDDIDAEPIARDEEIEFLITHAARYLTKDPTMKDVRSIYAGLRPLVKNTAKKTAEISRDHSIIISDSGLVSIVGGKWTTYRKMAADTVNTAAVHAMLPYKECITNELKVHGAVDTDGITGTDYYYGSDLPLIATLITENLTYADVIHERLPYRKGEIVWAVRNEMCMTVEDALSRRTRALLLDAAAAVEASQVVAELMAGELGHDQHWIETQVREFKEVAKTYLPSVNK